MKYLRRPRLVTLALISAASVAMTGCAAESSPSSLTPTSEVKTSAPAKPKASAAPEFGTAEATKEAVAHATKYARASHTNGYFLSGQLAQDGSSIDEMVDFLEE